MSTCGTTRQARTRHTKRSPACLPNRHAGPFATAAHPMTGALCVNAQDKAAALAHQYASVAAAVPQEHPTVRAEQAQAANRVAAMRADTTPGPDALESPFSLEELRHALYKLPTHKAPGGDAMPAELLKRAGPAGRFALLDLMNVVWRTQRSPRAWRRRVVVSIHKADDPTDCNNYQGLTLLPVFDKPLALLLMHRLGAHVPLHDQQYALSQRQRHTERSLWRGIGAAHPVWPRTCPPWERSLTHTKLVTRSTTHS